MDFKHINYIFKHWDMLVDVSYLHCGRSYKLWAGRCGLPRAWGDLLWIWWSNGLWGRSRPTKKVIRRVVWVSAKVFFNAHKKTHFCIGVLFSFSLFSFFSSFVLSFLLICVGDGSLSVEIEVTCWIGCSTHHWTFCWRHFERACFCWFWW